MAEWDEDSPKLRANLRCALRRVRDEARERAVPSLAAVRRWHAITMDGLEVPNEAAVGAYRGEPGLESAEVAIGMSLGAPAFEVAAQLEHFQAQLRAALGRLDELIPPGDRPAPQLVAAVLDVCGWAHAEWVRIHPFLNGNGRTARFWANYVAMRYGLPPFVKLRPRPDGGYGKASAAAMRGRWQPTAELFRRMLQELPGAG